MSWASPIPASSRLGTGPLASALHCSRRMWTPDVYWVQAMSIYGTSADDPSLAWLAMPTGDVENLTYWDITGSPAQTNGGSAATHGGTFSNSPPKDGYWTAAMGFYTDRIWSWRATALLAHVAQISKVRLTGVCQGTLLQYPALGYGSAWIYTLETPTPAPPSGAVTTDQSTYYPTSAVYVSLTPGAVLEFFPTASPSVIDGSGVGWIPQACFVFNTHPSDFGF